jgi:predicted DNA-binding protein
MFRSLNYKFFILLSFFIFTNGCQPCFAQEKPNYVTFDEILNNLNLSSKTKKSNAEINRQIIEQIIEKKVDFILTKEDEEKLRKVGGNKTLFETINVNIPQDVKKKRLLEQEMQVVYKKFTDNYDGQTSVQRKIAIEAAKVFLQKYSDNPDVKEIIEYFKKYIPQAERLIRQMENYEKNTSRT